LIDDHNGLRALGDVDAIDDRLAAEPKDDQADACHRNTRPLPHAGSLAKRRQRSTQSPQGRSNTIGKRSLSVPSW
jgi:hypothetical protein